MFRILGLLKLSKISRKLRLFIQDILNLALLPEEYIQRMYGTLKAELMKETIVFNDIKIPFGVIMKRFFEYYEDFWLKIITPKRFSVYNAQFKTNNLLERFNRDLHEYFGTRPSLISFLDNILKVQQDMHIAFLAAESSGVRLAKKTPQAKEFERRLRENIESFKNFLPNKHTDEMIHAKLKEFLTSLRTSSQDVHESMSQFVDKGRFTNFMA